MSQAERRRYEDIAQIQCMLSEGYAPVQIKEILQTSYARIRRYSTGDPLNLCRFIGGQDSEADLYKETIIDLLYQNVSLKQAFIQVSDMGYTGKRTAFSVYCRKLLAKLGISYKPRKNVAGVPIEPKRKKPQQRYVSLKDFFQYLWSGKEMDTTDVDYILSKYPNAAEIQQCIIDFRNVYNEKNVNLLERFIESVDIIIAL